jgi:hypothetical protein
LILVWSVSFGGELDLAVSEGGSLLVVAGRCLADGLVLAHGITRS